MSIIVARRFFLHSAALFTASLLFAFLLFPVNAARSQPPALAQQPDDGSAVHFVAEIRVHTAAELHKILQRVEQVYQSSIDTAQDVPPVVLLLHGAEARSLLRSNYATNKQLVDLAARLTAFELVDIKVCETWMGNQRLDKIKLQPFIGTVPFAPAEEKRLVEELGYHYF